jgi:acetoin utilization deacetylase AcuC-like enzyme
MAVLYYTDCYELPLPPGHRFPLRKYRLTRELLARDGRFELVPAPLAGSEAVELAHDPGYVRRFFEGTLTPPAIRRIGFPWSEGLVRRTLASIGGTLAATRDALATHHSQLATGFGATLAGGTHHAFRCEGSGFCVFNDIAVAILWARANTNAQRVAVLDLDVHQGDGTASIFQGDAAVLTVSVHGKNNFPFRKQRSAMDVELPDGTGDAEYLEALKPLLPAIAAFAPDLIFYQSGVDALACDRLGRLALSHGGLKMRDRLVFEFCRQQHIPVVVTLGGGYGASIEATAEAHANVYRMAARVFLGNTSRTGD